MVPRWAGALLASSLLLMSCSGEQRAPDAGSSSPSPTATASITPALDFANVETVATGLEIPWAIAFAGEDAILITERPGRVRAIEGGELREEPVLDLEVRHEGEAGLMGLAVHPEFPEQRFAYLAYTTPSGNRVSRFRIEDDFTLTGERIILDGLPSAAFHDGGRLAFGPDGMLYVTVGDAGEPMRAADRGALQGKILRVRQNGRVPDDNPFPGSPVFSYGHRNPQGIAWAPDGTMYASEHGPTSELDLCCHDEINLIEAGGFYGWPFRAGRARAFDGSPPERARPPLAESGDPTTWAPAGIVVVEREGAGEQLLVATLAGERLLRFPIEDGSLGLASVALEGYGRLRALTLGPDGCLYIGTSNRDGRGTVQDGDDKILRVCPAAD